MGPGHRGGAHDRSSRLAPAPVLAAPAPGCDQPGAECCGQRPASRDWSPTTERLRARVQVALIEDARDEVAEARRAAAADAARLFFYVLFQRIHWFRYVKN